MMIRIGLLIVIAFIAVFATFDIVGGNNLKDAVVGHTTDIVDRVTHEDSHVVGDRVALGEFRDDDVGRDIVHWADGDVSLVVADGQWYIQLGSNFNSGAAPDLYIYTATSKVVDEGSFHAADTTEIAKLQSGSGAQFYEIEPVEGSVEVIIWCKRFGAFIGAVTLEVN